MKLILSLALLVLSTPAFANYGFGDIKYALGLTFADGEYFGQTRDGLKCSVSVANPRDSGRLRIMMDLEHPTCSNGPQCRLLFNVVGNSEVRRANITESAISVLEHNYQPETFSHYFNYFSVEAFPNYYAFTIKTHRFLGHFQHSGSCLIPSAY